jgi:hypothetical protein
MMLADDFSGQTVTWIFTYGVAIHDKCVTVIPKYIPLTRRIRDERT